MPKKWTYPLLGACLLQAVVISPVFADAKIKYGEWEINVTVEGLPIAMPPHTQHICLDKEHLVPGEKQAGQCKMSWQIDNNTVNWKVSCSNGGNGNGKVVYDWDKMQGSSVMNMPSAHMSMHSSLTGKWVAATCSAQSRQLLQSNQSR